MCESIPPQHDPRDATVVTTARTRALNSAQIPDPRRGKRQGYFQRTDYTLKKRDANLHLLSPIRARCLYGKHTFRHVDPGIANPIPTLAKTDIPTRTNWRAIEME